MANKVCPLLKEHGIVGYSLCYGNQGCHLDIEERNKGKLICLNCPLVKGCIFDRRHPITPAEKELLLRAEMPKEIKTWKQQTRLSTI